MESSIIPLGHKIDFMLARLDSVFKERKLKKDDMEKIFEGIVSNDEGLQAFWLQSQFGNQTPSYQNKQKPSSLLVRFSNGSVIVNFQIHIFYNLAKYSFTL